MTDCPFSLLKQNGPIMPCYEMAARVVHFVDVVTAIYTLARLYSTKIFLLFIMQCDRASDCSNEGTIEPKFNIIRIH